MGGMCYGTDGGARGRVDVNWMVRWNAEDGASNLNFLRPTREIKIVNCSCCTNLQIKHLRRFCHQHRNQDARCVLHKGVLVVSKITTGYHTNSHMYYL